LLFSLQYLYAIFIHPVRTFSENFAFCIRLKMKQQRMSAKTNKQAILKH